MNVNRDCFGRDFACIQVAVIVIVSHYYISLYRLACLPGDVRKDE